ncbi:MAG TPA: hypothetical protein VGK44_01345 [Casimicrobiaceae bacterium]|jgi:hypothetical protein
MFSRDSSGQKSAAEFAEQLKELLAANIAGNARLVNRLSDVIRRAKKADARNTGNPPDAAALLSRWLEFNLASYAAVSHHGLALLNGLLTAAENALDPTRKATAPPSPAPRIELRLEGRPGERATSAFLVENHFDRPLDVTFECGKLTGAAGASLPASLIAFDPATLSISPRGQAVVQVSVLLTSDFIVGQAYSSAIRLLGLDAREIGLSVTVHPPVEPTSDFDQSPAREKPDPAEKRRARSSK